MTSRILITSGLYLLLLTVVGDVHAQVNIEKLRDFDVNGMVASFSGDFAALSGNSDLFEVGIGTRLDVKKGKHYSFILGSVRYGENNGETFKNRSFAHLRYNYKLKSWLVGELFSQIEQDGFTLLHARLLGGGGIRFRHVHGERVGLFQGTSLMYEYEDLDSEKVVLYPDESHVYRWSNYLNLRLIFSENTSLLNTVYVQPQVDAFEDVRILAESLFTIALTSHITFQTTFNLRYDSRPPDGIEDLDLAVRNGLVVTF